MKPHWAKHEINKTTWDSKLHNSHTYVKVQVSVDVVLVDRCRSITQTRVR
jgi:hypothetical protein